MVVRPFEWNVVTSVKSGLQEDIDGYARVDVALLMKKWFKKIDWKSVSTRLLIAEFKLERLRMLVMVAYALYNAREDEFK